MKKQKKTTIKTPLTDKKTFLEWKKRRELVSKSIPLEVDLENRRIFFQTDIKEKLHFDFKTDNVDKLITTYLDPKDTKKVMNSLVKAKNGLERPIPFNFIHPLTSKSFHFEYRYQIIYVKYSSTRLQGELVKMVDAKLKKKPRTSQESK